MSSTYEIAHQRVDKFLAWAAGICIGVCAVAIINSFRYNSDTAKHNVQSRYPLGTIIYAPGKKFTFIVSLPDGTVHEVKCESILNDEINDDTVIMTAADDGWHAQAVKAGKAEYYLDENNVRQWRWKP
jgi:hypothetical protein